LLLPVLPAALLLRFGKAYINVMLEFPGAVRPSLWLQRSKTPEFPPISIYEWSSKDTSTLLNRLNHHNSKAGDAESIVKAMEAAQKAFDTD